MHQAEGVCMVSIHLSDWKNFFNFQFFKVMYGTNEKTLTLFVREISVIKELCYILTVRETLSMLQERIIRFLMTSVNFFLHL